MRWPVWGCWYLLHSQIRSEQMCQDQRGNLYAQAAASMLAVHLVRHYTSRGATLQAVPPPPRSMTKRQVQHVLEFIQAHLNEQLSLDSLARQAGFSSPHFGLLFQRATGASPHQFVLRQRLECAQQLLERTEVPLAEVAAACGFTDQSHLTQVFTKQVAARHAPIGTGAPGAQYLDKRRTILKAHQRPSRVSLEQSLPLLGNRRRGAWSRRLALLQKFGGASRTTLM
jgi:AraC-like DNA-binding protein